METEYTVNYTKPLPKSRYSDPIKYGVKVVERFYRNREHAETRAAGLRKYSRHARNITVAQRKILKGE
jgi:hypothetical protein